MDNHVTQLSRSLNFQIRNLSRMRRFIVLTRSCHNAVRSLILSRLDYCNAFLNGIFKEKKCSAFRESKTDVLGSFKKK